MMSVRMPTLRASSALKGLGGMFFKKSEYKDEEDNLLK